MTQATPKAGIPLLLARLGLLLTLAVVLALWWTGDYWYFSFALLYGPRWSTLPLLLLAIPLLLRRPGAGVRYLVATALLVLVGIMGMRVGPARLRPAGEVTLRVLTYNLHSSREVRDALLKQLVPLKIDLALTVECPGGSLSLPTGWEARSQGEVCLFSRHPILIWQPYPRSTSLARARIELEGKAVDLGLVHLTSPREALTSYLSGELRPEVEHSVTRNAEERRNKAYRARGYLEARGLPIIIGGDFNLPPESKLFREAFAPFRDAFEASGLGFGYTWHSRWHGLRIDHILLGGGAEAVRTWVGPDLGSDHLPVIAEIRIQ